MVEAGLIFCRWLHYLDVTILFGLLAFGLHARGTAIARAVPASVGRSLAALAVVSGLGWFWMLAASVGGGLDQAFATLPLLVTGADIGPIWGARMLLALALCLPVPRATVLRAILAGLLLASLALTGHARSHGGALGIVQVGADALHLVAAGAWLGALTAFLALLRAAPEDPATIRALAGFSAVGMIAVGVLAATGTFNGWLMLGGPGPLVTTLYGRLLAAKVALFAAMVAFAAHNRLALVPALQAQASAGLIARLRRNIAGEQALGAGLLLLVAALGTLDPSS